MNQQAAQALYAAEAAGVKQIKGYMTDGHGGRCALGVLNAAGLVSDATFREWHGDCPLCGCPRALLERHLIAHLNDDHGLTFAEIARTLGPDHAQSEPAAGAALDALSR